MLCSLLPGEVDAGDTELGAQVVIKAFSNYRPYYHHRRPRIDWEERQRRVKTGHDKRNPGGDVIIRHNYVAAALGQAWRAR